MTEVNSSSQLALSFPTKPQKLLQGLGSKSLNLCLSPPLPTIASSVPVTGCLSPTRQLYFHCLEKETSQEVSLAHTRCSSQSPPLLVTITGPWVPAWVHFALPFAVSLRVYPAHRCISLRGTLLLLSSLSTLRGAKATGPLLRDAGDFCQGACERLFDP